MNKQKMSEKCHINETCSYHYKRHMHQCKEKMHANSLSRITDSPTEDVNAKENKKEKAPREPTDEMYHLSIKAMMRTA